MATFWQVQLLPKEITKVETSHTKSIPEEVIQEEAIQEEFVQEEVAEEIIFGEEIFGEEIIEKETIEAELTQQSPLEIKARSEVARRLRGWLPSWDGPLRQAS
jgi:hypothetical protein